jgi:hypothetical protein
MSLVRFATFRSLRRTAAAVAMTIAYLSMTPTTHAQFGGRAGFEDAFMPDFLSRDVTLFVESLGLEEWQRPIIESLVMDYKLSFDAGVDGVKAEMAKVKDSLNAGNTDVMKLIMVPIERWTNEKKRLKEEFLDNVKTQLSDQQVERWPKFERAMRREKVLATAELQGEAVNLLTVLRSLELAPSTLSSLDTKVEEYEVRLDEALASRQRRIEAEQEKIKDAMTSGDHQAGVNAQESIMSARVQVRNVQDESRDTIRDALTEVAGAEVGASFEAAALEKGYPKVYRADPILPLFASAMATEGITPEQTTALETLKGQYLAEIPDVNARLRDAYRSEEPKEPRRRVELMMARQAGGEAPRSLRGESEVVQSARKAREEVYDRYRNAIMEILNEEQKQQMPNYGKGERMRPEDAERIREAKAAGARVRQPGNNPVAANPPADRSGKSRKERATGDAQGRIRNSPGTGDPRRDGPTDRPPSGGGNRPPAATD